MAVNTDKKALCEQIAPEVNFAVTASGITITSARINTPRFVPFDNPGKCKSCKSSDLELDYALTKEGVTIYANRLKGAKFVPFDNVFEFPDHCFFRLRAHGRTYNIPHSDMMAEQPIGLSTSGGLKRGADGQMPIDQFLQPKRPKVATPEIEFLGEVKKAPEENGKKLKVPKREVNVVIGGDDDEEEEVDDEEEKDEEDQGGHDKENTLFSQVF